uniref:Protein kinase domain-containing protein n=2 Tax=Neobodo designis TaxID=312471 RepID=A0A7S1M0H6_NEODS
MDSDDEFDEMMVEMVASDASTRLASLEGPIGPVTAELLRTVAKLAHVELPKAPQSQSAVSSRNCVVCGRSDRAQKLRKSGPKCDPWCIGQPSSKKETVIEEMKFIKRETNDKGQEVINGLVLERKLGKGAFGNVMLARAATGQEYAVKILSKSRLRKLGAISKVQAEIEILKKLQHPHVMRVYAVFDDPSQDNLFLVSEYLKNGESYRLKEDGTGDPPLSPDRLKKFAFGIARGLQYIHARGVAHRDIKPENILLDADDKAKLADFGVSDDSDRAFTQSTEGSPAFFPPEEFLGLPVSGVRHDLWAFGVTLYCMAFGRLPFFSLDRQDLANQVTEGRLSFPPDADEELVDLLRHMLDRDPERRATVEFVLTHPFLRGLRSIKGRPEIASPVDFSTCTFSAPQCNCRAALSLSEFCAPDVAVTHELVQGGDYSISIYRRST